MSYEEQVEKELLNVIFIAPGDYAPEKSANALLDNSPKYTFGMKTSAGKSIDTPGEVPVSFW